MEEKVERAFEYAKNGFFVTLFDAYGHGELKKDTETLEPPSYDKSNIDKLLRLYCHKIKR